jgi:cell division protein FtsB
MTVGRAIVPGLLVATFYFAVFGGEYSVFELRATRTQLDVERTRLAAIEVEIDSLAALADSLEHDPVKIERVAREEFGMIREGETLYRFADPDARFAEEPAPER